MPPCNNIEVDRKRFTNCEMENIDIFGIDRSKTSGPLIVLREYGFHANGSEIKRDMEFTNLKEVRALATHLLSLCDRLEPKEQDTKDK